MKVPAFYTTLLDNNVFICCDENNNKIHFLFQHCHILVSTVNGSRNRNAMQGRQFRMLFFSCKLFLLALDQLNHPKQCLTGDRTKTCSTKEEQDFFLCFKPDLTAPQVADICGVNRNTASHYYGHLRRAILSGNIHRA
ncbi:MAG: hypothetical protein J1D88_04680 [Treponema sp.]|nr:hypothetical protein [Treponema sp.]